MNKVSVAKCVLCVAGILLLLGSPMTLGSTIAFRTDRVALLNGKPFFPLGVWNEFENASAYQVVDTFALWDSCCGCSEVRSRLCSDPPLCTGSQYNTFLYDTLDIDGTCRIFEHAIHVYSTQIAPIQVQSRNPFGYDTLRLSGFNTIQLNDCNLDLVQHGSKGLISLPAPLCLSFGNPSNSNRILASAAQAGVHIIADWLPYWDGAVNLSVPFNYNYCVFSIDQNVRKSYVHNLVNWGVVSDSMFLGWSGVDEQTAFLNDSVSEAVATIFDSSSTHIVSHDPNHMRYENFYPLMPMQSGWSRDYARSRYIAQAKRFAKAFNVLSVTMYPVYWKKWLGQSPSTCFNNGKLSAVTDYVGLFVDSIGGDTIPVWQTLEAKVTRPYDTVFYALSYHDARYEAYSSIIAGATGLLWYGWSDDGNLGSTAVWDIANRRAWDTVKALVRTELSGIQDILTASDSPLHLTVSNNNVSIIWKLKDFGGFYYLFAANRADSIGSATISGLSCPNDTAEVMFENRRLGLSSSQQIVDNFAPFDVHVYKIFKTRGVVKDNATWTAGSYKVTGDIKIDTNVTVSIQPNTKFRILPNTDSLHSGNDVNKVEFIVEGILSIAGNSANPVRLQPLNATSDSAWYGIVVAPRASASISNAAFKHAYNAIRLRALNGSTVQNCLFDSCFTGIYGERGGVHVMQSDTFLKTTYGVRLRGEVSGSVKQCYFRNSKYATSVENTAVASVKGSAFRLDYDETPAVSRAISAQSGSTVGDTDNLVVNYSYGLYVAGYGTNVGVSGCSFGSDSLIDFHAFMDRGVYADNTAAMATCKIRNSCFGSIRDVGVGNGLNAVNLGLDTSYGNNYFENHKVFKVGPCNSRWQWNPRYAVANYGTTTLRAVGNEWVSHWELCCDSPYVCQDTGWFYGPVDHSLPQTDMMLPCNYQGTPAKITVLTRSDALPARAEIHQNYPNPFNGRTIISFSLPQPSRVRIDLYNLLGQLIRTIIDDALPAGDKQVAWDGFDSGGHQVSSGVYFYRITAGDITETRKMVLLK